ncbi:hypothetical protein [Escherichia coli]|uniref:hypothetical protein n=1 Tax=Escherichia coli TaxID=562 RepID=UPI002FCD190B
MVSHYGNEIDFDTLYYNGTDITWEFDIPSLIMGAMGLLREYHRKYILGDNDISTISATILGIFHVILPKPPTTITIMPTTVTLNGYVNKIEKTKVTIRVNNPSGNTQMITAKRNAGGDSNLKSVLLQIVKI